MTQKDCSRCKGVGSYQYDDIHSKPCEQCCEHNNGWWELKEHYGEDNGKLCCLSGCGFVLPNISNESEEK